VTTNLQGATDAAEHAQAIIETLTPVLAEHRRRWAERCQAHGISIVGFGALALLEIHGPLPMSRLAEELGVGLPNATGIVGRLEERGVVARVHDETDRRVVRVEITAEGHRLIGEMEAARRERMTRLVARLEPAAQRRLLAAMRDLRAAAAAVAADEETR